MKPTRAFDFFSYQLENYAKPDCLSAKEHGVWRKYSTQDVLDISQKIGLGLLSLGVQKGDRVAIVSANRPEWTLADLGIQQVGAVSVPLYPNITVDDYSYILEHAEVKVIFLGNQELYEKVSAAAKAANSKAYLFSFDQLEGCDHWTRLEKLGENQSAEEVTQIKAGIKPQDLLTIIYTSGTTGKPKGVMLTHQNVVSNTISVANHVGLEKGVGRALSFLPLCHIYERTGLYFFIYSGLSIYFAESMETIGENLKEVKPTTFNTVPRLLEKIYDKILAKGLSLKGATRSLFFWALDLGLKYEPHKDQGASYNFQLWLANKIIFKKWREAFGGNISLISSGAAALQPRLARVFWAAGIKVCEGYGLTETSPVITASHATHEQIRIGCVGTTIEGVEIKIAEDGEILAKGPNVMQGYFKQPELTEQVLKDGWFHTGDIGEIVEGKYLRITDRKKEMFKTSGGKYVAPQVVENRLKESRFIEQVMVVGDARKFPSALIVPEFEALGLWCKEQGIATDSPGEIIKQSQVLALFQKEVDQQNLHFGKWEQIKRFTLLEKPWGIDSGELTPTLKLKRRIIQEKYSQEIEAIYNN